VFDYGETKDVAFIVMEFVDGLSLRTHLEQERFLPIPHVLNIMRDVLEGLQYSHAQKVIHRDIKPANIMLTNADKAKIADFGIARIKSSNITQTGAVIGAWAYMSPEQLLGEPVDNRTDIYSAGVVLYELLAGERPFEGSLATIMHKALHTVPPKLSDVSVQVAKTFDAVVARAMAKKAEDRFATAAEFSDTLFRAHEATVSLARPQRTPPASVSAPARATGSRPSLRRPASAKGEYDVRKIAAGLLLVGAALAGGFAYVFHRTPERATTAQSTAQSDTAKQSTAQEEKKQNTPSPTPTNALLPASDTTAGTPSTPSQPAAPSPPAPSAQPATTATTEPALPTPPLPEGTINDHPVATVSPIAKTPIDDALSPNHVLIDPTPPTGPINLPPTILTPDLAGPPARPLVAPPLIESPPRVQPTVVKQGPIVQAPKPPKPKLRSPPPSNLATQSQPATASTQNRPNASSDRPRNDLLTGGKSGASPSAHSEAAALPSPPKMAPEVLFGGYIIGPGGLLYPPPKDRSTPFP
jgi:serine/threonine-protein kinase